MSHMSDFDDHLLSLAQNWGKRIEFLKFPSQVKI